MLRDEYLLDPAVAYLNHGGFGALARPVLEARERHLRRVEANPTAVYKDELAGELETSMAALAPRLGCDTSSIAFVPNVTFALNLVARSLMGGLGKGDEVLVTDLEYGAQQLLWSWVCESTGARLRNVALGAVPDADVVEEIAAHAGGRTRIALVSHITSSTARLLPVREIAARLHERGTIVVVDGAHAPGQIDLDLPSLGCDYYGGNLHKWFAAPRGAGILYATPSRQEALDPLVIGWGGTDRMQPLSSRIHSPGTIDASTYLSVPEALLFHDDRLAPEKEAARARLLAAAHELESLGYERLGSHADGLMMSAFFLPEGAAGEALAARLRSDKIEAIVTEHSGRAILRICVAWYTCDEELERLFKSCAG